MIPKDGRCEEHGLYLYRTGFGWSCKLGCYYCDDPQKIKDGYIQKYKEELKDKIKELETFDVIKNLKIDVEKGIEKLNWQKAVWKDDVIKLLE